MANHYNRVKKMVGVVAHSSFYVLEVFRFSSCCFNALIIMAWRSLVEHKEELVGHMPHCALPSNQKGFCSQNIKKYKLHVHVYLIACIIIMIMCTCTYSESNTNVTNLTSFGEMISSKYQV